MTIYLKPQSYWPDLSSLFQLHLHLHPYSQFPSHSEPHQPYAHLITPRSEISTPPILRSNQPQHRSLKTLINNILKRAPAESLVAATFRTIDRHAAAVT